MESTKKTQNKTEIERFRLTRDEVIQLENDVVNFGFAGRKSAYIRHRVFSKDITLKAHDETSERFNIEISDLANQVRKIGINHNQIARFIQANPSSDEIEMLLEKSEHLMNKVLYVMEMTHQIVHKVAERYNVRVIPVGNKILSDEQFKNAVSGKEVVVRDVIHNGKRCNVIVTIANGKINKKFKPIAQQL